MRSENLVAFHRVPEVNLGFKCLTVDTRRCAVEIKSLICISKSLTLCNLVLVHQQSMNHQEHVYGAGMGPLLRNGAQSIVTLSINGYF